MGKEESKKFEQKVINKIGEDKDVLSFVNGKILTLLCFYLMITLLFILFFFISLAEKDILSIISNSIFILFFVHSIVEDIILINKLQKTQITSKK